MEIKKPLITSITGPDGSGKTVVSEHAVVALGCNFAVGLIGSIGNPPFFQNGTTREILYMGPTNSIDRLYRTAQDKKSAMAVLASLVLHSYMTGRLVEPHLARKGVDIVIRDRDPFVDPAALSKIYVANMSTLTLIKMIQAVSNHFPTDMLFLLERSERRMKTKDCPDMHEASVSLEDYEMVIPVLLAAGFVKQMRRIKNNTDCLDDPVEQITNSILPLL